MVSMWRNKANPARFRLCGSNTDTPHGTVPSLRLPVCIWATWRGLNLHPSAPFVDVEQSCPVLAVCPGISSQCFDRDVSHWTPWLLRQLVLKRFVPTRHTHIKLPPCPTPSLHAHSFPSRSIAEEALVFITTELQLLLLSKWQHWQGLTLLRLAGPTKRTKASLGGRIN